uniref:Uncharacterized protein n=1 Tax=Cannabis sativa TaxID=3483 RepID=A0A803P533_CANSA
MSDDFVEKVEGAPFEDIMSCLVEMALQFMIVYSRASIVGLEDFDLLKKQNTTFQEGVRKAKLGIVAKEKEVDDLDKAKDQAMEKAKKLEGDNATLSRDLETKIENEKKAYDQHNQPLLFFSVEDDVTQPLLFFSADDDDTTTFCWSRIVILA